MGLGLEPPLELSATEGDARLRKLIGHVREPLQRSVQARRYLSQDTFESWPRAHLKKFVGIKCEDEVGVALGQGPSRKRGHDLGLTVGGVGEALDVQREPFSAKPGEDLRRRI